MYMTLPPGPQPRPVVGNILQFRKGQLAFVTSLQREYGKASTFYFGSTPMVMFTTPEAVRYVLVEHARDFTIREITQGLQRLLGDGLLTTDGDFHRQQRRLMLPAFHRKRVESYCDVMVAYTERMLQRWQPGRQVNIAAEMHRLTLEIVANALFNVDISQESTVLGKAFNDVREFPNRRRFSFRSWRINLPFTAYGRFVRGKAMLDKTVYDISAQRRSTGEDAGDVISMLLAARDEDGAALSNVQVHDEIMTLFAAGHETTANALTWTLYLLPAGSFAVLCTWVIHHMAEYFVEPERFWPERFDPAAGEKHPSFAYFPFGAGPRMCIGATFAMMEAWLLLATIIQRYSPALVPGHRVEPRPMVTLHAKFGMQMVLVPTKEMAAVG